MSAVSLAVAIFGAMLMVLFMLALIDELYPKRGLSVIPWLALGFFLDYTLPMFWT